MPSSRESGQIRGALGGEVSLFKGLSQMQELPGLAATTTAAGFLALGLALRSGRPVPVCTTSGSAVANLHPAVLEASYAGVPLLVLSADRPPEMVGTGANQAIDQAGLFGGAVRLALTG